MKLTKYKADKSLLLLYEAIMTSEGTEFDRKKRIRKNLAQWTMLYLIAIGS